MTDQPLLPFTAFDHQALQKAQATNLRWCEAWGRTLQPIAGVPIGVALTFDLLQLINRAVIENILGPNPNLEVIKAEMKQRMETPPVVAIEKPKRRRPGRKPVKWEVKA